MHRLQKVFTLTKLIPKARLNCGILPAFPLANSKPNLHLGFSLNSTSQRFYTTSDSDADSNGNGSNRFGSKLNTISAPYAQNQINKNPIFVSKFFEITNEEIFRFLDSVKLEYRVRPSGQIVTKCCPFCEKPHHNKPDNMWSLNMKPDSGAFLCFRCGTRGSWFDFKNMLIGNGKHVGAEIDGPNNLDFGARKPNAPSSGQEPKLASESVAYLRLMSLLANDFPEINQYLTGYGPEDRHLSLETLEKYKVGVGFESFLDANGEYTELPCVYFPMYACKKDKSIKKPRGKQEADTQEEAPPQVDLKDSGLDSSNLSIIEAINQENNAGSDKQTIDVNKQAKSQKPVIEINDANNILVRTKIRAIFKKNKGHQRMEPAPGYWGLFGLNTVPARAKAVVLTEGEYDAMAVYEATKLPAISLPNGANHLPLQVLPWLEKFERIYLWMDADAVGQTNAVNFAQKLGVGRVYIVNTKKFDPEGPKDANDALRKDPSSLIKYINEAKPLTRDSITTFSEMKFQILNRILRFEENTGLKSEYFRWFNSKIKGFRKGEMTILTGGTGSGKTTLLSQLSLDFAKQGIGTLWGSFEVKNDILMTNMLMQYSGINLYKEPHKFEYHSQSFEKIPLYYLKYFGANDVEKVLHSIEYAIYAFDIGHVIIDNLQFLLSGQGKGFERFDIQDDAIAKLRDLATTKNVHVTLVIHPKKVDDNQDLTISSVFGSAKATQEADNILLIQNRPKYKVVEVRKNRFDGDLGKIPLGFDKDTKRFFELKESEVFNLHRTPETMKELVERRKSQVNPEQLGEAIHEQDKSGPESNEDIKKKMESIFEESAGVTNKRDIGKENGAAKKANSRSGELQYESETATKDGSQEDIEEVYSENADPEVNLENYGPVVDEEIAKVILESSLNQNDQGEVKSSGSETDTIKEELVKTSETVEASKTEKQENQEKKENEEVPVQAQEKVVETLTEEENKSVEKPKKKEGKKGGLYGKLYVEQEKQVTTKNSFYTDEDREAVRENMEFLENERLQKAAQFKKRKFRPDENPGYDMNRYNDNRKK